MKFKKKAILIFLCFFILIFVGCQRNKSNEKIINDTPSNLIVENNKEEGEEETEETDDIQEEMKDPKELIDLSLKPNEAGEVMILMYHNIGKEESEWTRTPENFKKDLLTLYEKGYRAVSLADYINNDMCIEAGMTPVVITFDDGNENNFRMIEDETGKYIIDSNSAIGILEAFREEHPDFNTTATFFIFGNNPFGQPEFIKEKFNFLIQNGYDIGNHTVDHRSMKKTDDEEVIQEALAKQVAIVNKILPEYDVNTYALCYGERPSVKELYKYLQKGSYGGIDYENIAILNVGWNPAPSPISNKFNPLSLPRIRASEIKVDNVGLFNWLEYFDNNPQKRYISDGVNDVITVPKELEESINLDKINMEQLYLYED